MNFDLRFPIGVLFILIGLTMAIYGVLTFGSEIYTKSLGINVNVWWGGALIVFGGGMLGSAYLHKKK